MVCSDGEEGDPIRPHFRSQTRARRHHRHRRRRRRHPLTMFKGEFAGAAAEAGAAPVAPPPPPRAPVPAPRAPRHAHDYCKGPRKCWNAVVRALGATALLTALAVLMPVIYLTAGLIYSSTTSYVDARTVLGPALTVIATLTYLAGIIGWVAIWWKLQNLLGVCAWAYGSIGEWALITSIVVVSGYSWYISFELIRVIFWAIAPPILLYVFCAAIIDAHRTKLTEDIAVAEAVESATVT
jgi:hypothetical protein